MLYLHKVFNGIWMIDSDYATNYLPLISSYIEGKNTNNFIQKKKSSLSLAIYSNNVHSVSEYKATESNESNESQFLDNAPEGSIAILNIRGAITKHDQFCGPSGMVTLSRILESCYANDNIKGAVLVAESGGGEGCAMRMINETIAKRNKPIIGFVEDFAASAAYGIVSGCDMIVANSKLAQVGSIGTYQTIADYNEYFKNKGIDIKEIYATQSTDKNGDVKEAFKGNLEPLRKTVDVFNESFLAHIESSRGEKLTSDRNVWGTGKMYFAEEAIQLGLIDGIDTFENVLNYF